MPMKMKSIDLFCASPASTAICSSMEQRSIVRTNGIKPLNPLNSNLVDRYKTRAPCISELPFTPTRKPGSTRKSSVDISDLRYSRLRSLMDAENNNNNKATSLDLAMVLNPGDQGVIKSIKYGGRRNNGDYYGRWEKKSIGQCRTDSPVLKSSSSVAKTRDQVVVLRVSLHCKGCEGKLRKHLSKMEGVTSFSIDMETKKVTIIGNVTPSDVLTSISKVKNAQFWPSPASSASTSSSWSSTI